MKFSPIVFVLIAVFCIALPWPSMAMAGEKKVIIGFHEKPGWDEQAIIYVKRGKIRKKLKRLRAMAANLPSEEISEVLQDPRVAYVEEDVRIQAVDPMLAAEYDSSWGVKHIGSPAVHESGNLGAGVKIAVLDTGIDYTHPEFQNSYRGGIDFVNSDADPMDDNFLSHGTHIAGIISAAQDGVGVVGVAPEAELYAVKVIEGSGFGSLSHIVAGIDWAIDNQVNIINMSLTFGTNDFQSLREACDAAYAAGILIIGAAGNSNGQEVQFPAAYESVIAVNGTDPTDQNAAFSAFGPEIELTAPSTDILSTVTGGEYSSLFGTSQASAHVSGVAALILSASKEDGLTNQEARLQLQDSAIDLGVMNRDSVFGFGLVDAAAAVAVTDPPPPPSSEDEYRIYLSRESQHRRDDAQSLALPAGRYLVQVKNEGLNKIRVLTHCNDSSNWHRYKTLRFNKHGQQDKKFVLWLSDNNREVVFIPKGKIGRSAEVIVTELDTSERWKKQLASKRHKLKEFFAAKFF